MVVNIDCSYNTYEPRHVKKKTALCICENIDAGQVCIYRVADQHHYFHFRFRTHAHFLKYMYKF